MSRQTQLSAPLMSTMKNSPQTAKYLDNPSSVEDSDEDDLFLRKTLPLQSPSCISEQESRRRRLYDKLRVRCWPAHHLATCSAIALGLLAIILTLVLYYRITGLVRTDLIRTDLVHEDHVDARCGHSPEEAIEHGCIWDLMSFGWVHPLCYNATLSNKFIAQYGPWDWYPDWQKKHPIPPSDVSRTPHAYTRHDFHIAHCLYLLESVHVAAVNGRMVTHIASRMSHTEHCAQTILDPQLARNGSNAPLQFIRCVPLDEHNVWK